MRPLLTLLVAIILAIGTARADSVSYFATDFSGGMPDGVLCVDRDQQTLHFTMVQAGFDQGDSWRVMTIEGQSYAASPARHKTSKDNPAVAADDWLILPPVRIMGADAQLTWRGRTQAESIEQGCSYEVRISTLGGQPDDFTGAPAFSLDAETLNTWTTHTIDIGSYAGHEVWIAFRHTSLNREILAIDDISVSGSPGLYRLTDTTPRYVFAEGEYALTAQLEATSDTPITAFRLICDTDRGSYTLPFSGQQLTKDSQPLQLVVNPSFRMTAGESLVYSFRVEVDGNSGVEQPAIDGQLSCYLFEPRHRTVAEEGTGMWCGYCPRGIVAMREMRQKYPDTFIGIAVHYDDALGTDVQQYCSALGFPSFPTAFVNRSVLCGDPYPQGPDGRHSIGAEGGLETYFLAEQSVPAPADLELLWTDLGSGKLGLFMDAHFATRATDADYRFFAVAVEDEVSRSSYYQTNYYSDYNLPMGGFETEDEKIVPFTFDEVARGVLTPLEGISDAIPAAVEPGRHYAAATTVKAPKYDNLSNVRVVLMLLDARTGHVVNALQTSAATNAEYEACLTGLTTATASPQPAAARYTLDGRRATAGSGISIDGGRKVLR